MQQEGKWLVQALQQAHFNKVDIQKLDSATFIKNYLKKLDKQKLYFTQPEVDAFVLKFSPTLITYFKQGNLFPGFEIYNIYKNKSIGRINWVTNYLKTNFNFDENLTYETKRDELPWKQNISDLNNSWEKLIKFEVLGEILSSYDTNQTYSDLNMSMVNKLTNSSKEKGIEKSKVEKNLLEFEATDVQELYLKR